MAICNNKKCSLGECDQPETCTAYVPVITNADRIRSLSDEELAAWAINEAPKIGFRYTSSETGLLKWLKQPAEEDD